MQTQQISQTIQIRKAFKYLMGSIIIGLASNFVFAFQSANLSQGISVSVVGFMYSGAALLVGCFIGFLFGIPRSLQQNIDNNTWTTEDMGIYRILYWWSGGAALAANNAKGANSGCKNFIIFSLQPQKGYLFSCYLRFLWLKILLDTGSKVGLLVFRQRVKFI